MYIFELWTQAGRERIAKAELDDAWARERAALKPQYRTEFDKGYPAALARIVHNIHPLCILGLRRKI